MILESGKSTNVYFGLWYCHEAGLSSSMMYGVDNDIDWTPYLYTYWVSQTEQGYRRPVIGYIAVVVP